MKSHLYLSDAHDIAKTRSLANPDYAQFVCKDWEWPGFYLVCNEAEYLSSSMYDADCMYLDGRRIIP